LQNSTKNTEDDDSLEFKLQVARAECERDHLFFARYFSKLRWGLKFRVNWHHRLIADVIDDVLAGGKKNVAISVSPGSSKTELVVINFIARGLALNPRARFLHLSGSDSLASLNSATAREIVTSDEYQAFWPLKIAEDAKAKKRWNVIVNGRAAGGVYATAIGGQVTGFRAGHMAPGFQGCILIDDPIKPEEAFSATKVAQANRRILTTIKSRKATPDTPMIIVMQRVAENDPVGFIQKGNVPGDWHFVKIPAVLDEEYVSALPERYRKLIEEERTVVPYQDGRRSYWAYKEPLDELLQMERGEGEDANGQKISRHVFSSQYQQAPRALGGNIIHGKDFFRYQVLPKLKWRKMFVDTAQKTKERNDWSVFEEWGLGADGRIYLVDMIRGRWEAPELQRMAIAFWAKAKARDIEHHGQLRTMEVEDKSSGTGLIQTIKLPPHNIPVRPIERSIDKLTRVMDALPYIESGQVGIPEAAPFTLDFVAECESFSADDSHDFDDQVDPLCDAVNDMLYDSSKLRTWEALGQKEPQSDHRIPGQGAGVQILRRYRQNTAS
jgi:predicted phage terminase large subunit-like protein